MKFEHLVDEKKVNIEMTEKEYFLVYSVFSRMEKFSDIDAEMTSVTLPFPLVCDTRIKKLKTLIELNYFLMAINSK